MNLLNLVLFSEHVSRCLHPSKFTDLTPGAEGFLVNALLRARAWAGRTIPWNERFYPAREVLLRRGIEARQRKGKAFVAFPYSY